MSLNPEQPLRRASSSRSTCRSADGPIQASQPLPPAQSRSCPTNISITLAQACVALSGPHMSQHRAMLHSRAPAGNEWRGCSNAAESPLLDSRHTPGLLQRCCMFLSPQQLQPRAPSRRSACLLARGPIQASQLPPPAQGSSCSTDSRIDAHMPEEPL